MPCRLPGGSGRSLQADDLIGGPDTEVFEKVRLAPRPGDEFVQPGGIEPLVGFRESSQRTPARGLALHAEPQQFQLFQAAERRPGEDSAVELQPPGLLADPASGDLVGADRDAYSGPDVQ